MWPPTAIGWSDVTRIVAATLPPFAAKPNGDLKA